MAAWSVYKQDTHENLPLLRRERPGRGGRLSVLFESSPPRSWCRSNIVGTSTAWGRAPTCTGYGTCRKAALQSTSTALSLGKAKLGTSSGSEPGDVSFTSRAKLRSPLKGGHRQLQVPCSSSWAVSYCLGVFPALDNGDGSIHWHSVS